MYRGFDKHRLKVDLLTRARARTRDARTYGTRAHGRAGRRRAPSRRRTEGTRDEGTTRRRRDEGTKDDRTTNETKPAIILWCPLVNSAGPPPQGVYQTGHNIMTALGKLCGCFPCGAQAVVKDRRVYQTGHNNDFLRVFGDYEFTKKL